ncbi:MAG: 30S ribosomal protein S20 [Planctomycetota bacterium]
MAHSLSSKKRVRQNARRRALNRTHRSALHTRLRRCAESFLRGNLPDAERYVLEACKHLDREADRGTLHRNAAARRKSRLAKRLNTLRQKAGAATPPAEPAT